MSKLNNLTWSRMVRRGAMVVLGIVGFGFAVSSPSRIADAKRLENPTAVFAALDKVTARISRLEVGLDDTSKFGALKITPRVCYSRPPTEPPKTTAFVEVTEIKLDGTERKIFSGWMFAQSPGLNAVEHPVFDVWLTDCAGVDENLVRREVEKVTGKTRTRKRKRRRRKKRRR